MEKYYHIIAKIVMLVGMFFVALSILLSSLFYYMAPLWLLLLLLSHSLWYYIKKIAYYLTLRADAIDVGDARNKF